MKNKKWILTSIIVAVAAAVAFLLFVMVRDLWPLVQEILKNQNDEQKSVDYIKAYGARGIPILIGIEALLAATNLFSGDPIHILAGLCYGVFLGSIIVIVGIAIGNAAIFLLFRQFRKLFSPLARPKKRHLIDVKKLEKMKHPEIIAGIAYIVPGLPDLVVPYVFSKIKISFWRYMLVITIASIPGVVLMTLTGSMLAYGNWEFVIGLVIVMVLATIIVFLNRKRIMKAFR